MNDIEETLKLAELRTRSLVHTRQAYRLLPPLVRPRILDLGCGRGLPTLELARLSDGEIVAVDRDAAALAHLQARMEKDDLSQRIEVIHVSIYETGFPDSSFDVIWEEGVMHLLDSSRSLRECGRLLRPGGFLVMHEDVTWFGSILDDLPARGFQVVAEHPLPRHFWWTKYYCPLEAAIKKYRESHCDELDSAELAQYEREIAMVKKDPDRFDCAFYILQKRR